MSNNAVKQAYGDSIPTIYVSLKPAALVHLNGQPQLAPIADTSLLESPTPPTTSSSTAATRTTTSALTGRWFKAPTLNGPWSFVASNALPPAFAQIPPQHPKAAVLASVAGTVPAREALIANSVPQTATVQRGKATLDVKYDGPAKFVAIEGTSLSYAQNTPDPGDPGDAVVLLRAAERGLVRRERSSGAWAAATSVPAVIYTIPPSSPVDYVTYVRIYGSTTDVVYAGYTPGYMGTVVAPGGVVVYGTGYVYPAWVGSVWYPVPITYGIGATVAYSTWGGWNVGFGIGYPVYPPYWGPYAYGAGFGAGMFTGLAVGAAIGASAWGWGWHGGYNVTVNNVYNHWGSGTVQARGNTYNYARVGNTTVARLRQQRLRQPRRGRLPQRERPVAEERERQLEQRQHEPGAAAGEPGPVERLVPVRRPEPGAAAGEPGPVERLVPVPRPRFLGTRVPATRASASSAPMVGSATARFSGGDFSSRFGGGGFGGGDRSFGGFSGFHSGGFGGFGGGFRGALRRPPLRKGVQSCYVCIESRRSPVRSSRRAARHRPRCWRAIRPPRAASRRGADSST